MDKITKVMYINLDHRTDRLAEITNELENILHFKTAERFPAIKHEHPILGCTMSHIYIWRRMIQEGWDTLMVFEDDAQVLTSRESIDNYINNFLEDDAGDILMIGNSCGDNSKYNNLLNRCYNTQTSSCYVLKRKFVETLIKEYFANKDDYMTQTHNDPDLMSKIGWIDVVWGQMQHQYFFLMPNQRQLLQRESYSDIQRRVVSYGL